MNPSRLASPPLSKPRSVGPWAALLLCLLVGPLACATADPPAPTSTLSLEPCSQWQDARCGTLRVYEDRAAAEGRQIDLNLVVLEALGNEPADDPIFYLAGGPGAAATDYIDTFISSPLRQKRDLVFVDQRGTGASNRLQCSFGNLQDVLDGGLLFDIEGLEECRAALEQKADLRLYTTDIAMDDLDDVRRALGYERINLIGGSYGTRAALVYMRRHPEHSRTATLRGVASTAFHIPRDMVGSLHSLRDLFDDCARDASCHELLPEPEKTLRSMLERLRDEPVEMELRDPRNGRMETVRLDDRHFVEMVRLLLYDSRSASYLPRLLAAAKGGDLKPLAEAGVGAISQLLPRLSVGMFLSVSCFEDAPYLQQDDRLMPFDSDNFFHTTGRAEALGTLCEYWPRGPLTSDYKLPVSSDVPTLLLSGAVDPVTPAAAAEAALPYLPNARHFVLPEMAHGPLAPGCVEDLLLQFLDQASAEGLDPACIDEIQRPPF